MSNDLNVLVALPANFAENIKRGVETGLENTGYYSSVNVTTVSRIHDFLTESQKAKYNYIIMFFALDDDSIGYNEVMDTVNSVYQRRVLYVVEDQLKGSILLNQLYAANFYNALFMSDCTEQKIAEMYQVERSSESAARYYGLNFQSDNEEDDQEEADEKSYTWQQIAVRAGACAAVLALVLVCFALIPSSLSKNKYNTEVVAHDLVGQYGDSENRVATDTVRRAEGEDYSLMDTASSNDTATSSYSNSEHASTTLIEHTGKDTITTVTRVVTGKDGVDGKNGANGKDGRDGLNGKDGTNGTNGTNGKNGVDGKNGEDGKDGINGVDGLNGKDGVDGKDGENGKDGKDGLNGKDGVNGEDGKDGVDGKNGEDGKDAYEIAVEEGFTGTREEWLISISGALSDFSVSCDNNEVHFFKKEASK